MGKTLDNENRRAVPRFHYGLIADLVSLSPGMPGIGARQYREAGQDHISPVTTPKRIGAETMRDGFGDGGRRMPPEFSDLFIPINEDNSVPCAWPAIQAVRTRDLPSEHNASRGLGVRR